MSKLFLKNGLIPTQSRAFEYFKTHQNPQNGLVADASREGSPCSIAATGFALSCYPIAVERGWISRTEALEKTLAALRFFADSEQNTQPTATGYRGFYYHFLDMNSGKRTWKSELSTIDSALLFLGFLTCAEYFGLDTPAESELRERALQLFARADWRWACNETTRVALAWKPEYGFLKAHWGGYNESLLLMLLALGAPEHSLPASTYEVWCETYQWKKLYGYEFLYAGPLFLHQFHHLWIDFRKIQDNETRSHNSDYFENSRRATYIQQEYCHRNPRDLVGYEKNCWGITASRGPGGKKTVSQGNRHFFGYHARGVPFGPDDGTLTPSAVIASLPFAPEIALPALEHIESTYPEMVQKFGFGRSFNSTFQSSNDYWIASEDLGLDQGPIIMAIENHLTGLPWNLLRNNKVIRSGLKRAGFTGG